MPNVVSTRLFGGELTTTVATVFTAVLRTEVTSIRISPINASPPGTARALVYHLPKDDTRTDDHLVYHGGATAEASASEGAGITLEVGDLIQASGTVDEFVLTLYGTTESITGAP